ncbi:MAG: LCP family protein [Synergistaceae bacterium]|jgi:LCP family protein required for cell wall assembly|nr:LCP family protein [Synergistaceae bacterium]
MFKWKNILLFLLLASFSFGVGVRYRFNQIDVPRGPEPAPKPVTESSVSPDVSEPKPPEKLDIAGRINILVLGEDNVEGSRRSDTILVATLDIDKRNIRVLSLPRDTRVFIPGHGNQKLNHAYAYGRAELVRATLERFLGIPIHYYVKVDYDNFPKLVDIVGGVDVFVGKPMKYTDKRGHLEINIPPGKQRMNGDTALKYVRFRKDALGDIGRVQRQQQFMKAMIHRMYEAENLVRFGTIVDEIKNTIVTDINPSTILQLGLFVRRLDKETDKMFFMMLPGTASIIDNLSYWVSDRNDVEPFLTADIDQLRDMTLKARKNQLDAVTLADDYSAENPETAAARTEKPRGVNVANAQEPSPQDILQIVTSMPEAVAVLNGTGKSGVGQSVASHLQKMGIDVAHVANAKHFDYRSSNIIYPEKPSENDRMAATLLSQLCGISTTLTRTNNLATYPSLIVGHDYEALLKRLENSYTQMQQ